MAEEGGLSRLPWSDEYYTGEACVLAFKTQAYKFATRPKNSLNMAIPREACRHEKFSSMPW